LALAFLFDLRITCVGQRARFFKGYDAHGLLCFGIQKGCGDFAIVKIFQASLAQSHAGNGADSIGHATIYLDPNNQLLPISAPGLVESEQTATEHRHASAQQLARAHVAMHAAALFQKLIERFHFASGLQRGIKDN